MVKRPARKEVPTHQTWDLDGLYPNTAAWEADLCQLEALLPDLNAYKGRLGESSAQLLACLTLADQVEARVERLFWYAYNNVNVDLGDPERQSVRDRAMAMNAKAGAAGAFIKPEILSLPDGTVEGWLQAEPGLGLFKLKLSDILAEKEHMLSAEAEGVIAQFAELTEAPYVIWQSTTQADIKYEPVTDEKGNQVPMSPAALQKLLQSPDRGVRQAAYESARKAYDAHKRTIAAAFTAAQKRDATLARLRRYPSSVAAALAPGHLPEQLFHNLLQVSAAGSEEFRRYNRFRRQAMGLEQLMPWDLSAPLDADVEAEVSFDEARRMVLEALAPLGADYRATLEEAFANRWVDWADNEGKRQGAYSYGCYGYHPVVFMTWQNTLANAFTLAHELGHCVHSVLSARSQPHVYGDYSLFLAEMASTTNELLLADYLLKQPGSRALRRSVLTRAIGSFLGNFWGASMSAAFQLKVHQLVEEGQPLTYESITAVNTEILARWYGDTVAVAPETMGAAWMRVLHHFRNFYSYQYATGISAACAFADTILTEGEPAVQRYLRFLSAGSSAHDIDLLKAAGVDMTTPAPMEKAVAHFSRLVTQLENA